MEAIWRAFNADGYVPSIDCARWQFYGKEKGILERRGWNLVNSPDARLALGDNSSTWGHLEIQVQDSWYNPLITQWRWRVGISLPPPPLAATGNSDQRILVLFESKDLPAGDLVPKGERVALDVGRMMHSFFIGRPNISPAAALHVHTMMQGAPSPSTHLGGHFNDVVLQSAWPPRLTAGRSEWLHELGDPESRHTNHGQPPPELILIHGLGGHFEETWRDDVASEPWPVRFLQRGNHHVLPPVRIFSVIHSLAIGMESGKGFVTDVHDSVKLIRNAIGRMCDRRATKVFLCHSLGCNLVKEILLEQMEACDSGEGSWMDGVKGVIFYGGPHFGAESASAVARVRASLEFRGASFPLGLPDASPAVLYLSRSVRQSQYHHDLTRRFLATRIPFLNFCEGKAVGVCLKNGGGQLALSFPIVTQEESDLSDPGLQTELKIPFIVRQQNPYESVPKSANIRLQYLMRDKHHLDICKPLIKNHGAEEDPVFARTLEALQAWLS